MYMVFNCSDAVTLTEVEVGRHNQMMLPSCHQVYGEMPEEWNIYYIILETCSHTLCIYSEASSLA